MEYGYTSRACCAEEIHAQIGIAEGRRCVRKKAEVQLTWQSESCRAAQHCARRHGSMKSSLGTASIDGWACADQPSYTASGFPSSASAPVGRSTRPRKRCGQAADLRGFTVASAISVARTDLESGTDGYRQGAWLDREQTLPGQAYLSCGHPSSSHPPDPARRTRVE